MLEESSESSINADCVDKFVILLSDLIGNRDSETMKIAKRVS